LVEVTLSSQNPKVITVTFQGEVRLAEVVDDRRFGDLVKTFAGAPFRVLCDFRQATTMEAGVAEVFMRAQSFALKANLEKDAFVTSDAGLRDQFNRIAHETRRFHWLGPLRFFDALDAASAYVAS
jgi:hypothetical protein